MKKVLVFSILLPLALASVSAVEVKKDGWTFPNPATAEKVGIKTTDTTSRIDGGEVVVKAYRKRDGLAFMTFEIEGVIFAAQFHIKDEDGKRIEVYSIVDNDGDGVFESKLAPGEFAKTPEWVILDYFKKHPELNDPGPGSETNPRSVRDDAPRPSSN